MDKKILMILCFGIFFVISCYGVLAATSFVVIERWGNYTGSVNLTLTTTLANALNVSCYYNASGGPALPGGTEFVFGTATNITDLNETLVTITSVDDSLFLYSSNITCNISATAGATSEVVSLENITFDSTAPTMTFYNVVSGGYYRSSVNFNASILDALVGMSAVYFNVTNSSGGNVTELLTTQIGGSYYSNDSFDTSSYTDGVYNLTVYANDTLDNLNTTAISFTIDNTPPSPSALTSSSVTISSLTITFSGADGTCTADRSEATISGSTLTETGLSCGTSYAYTITCTDTAGNAGSSSATSFSTSSCGAPAATSTTSQYTNTYKVTGEQFQQGYTKEIAVNHRAKVQVGASYHYVGVKAVTATTATIEITSDPVEVTLEVGEEVKMDVTEDGYYDIYVKLIDLESGKANVLIQSIYEEIPEGAGEVATSGEITGEEEEETIIEKITEKNLIWLWASIGLVLVVGLVIWLRAKRKPASKK